MARASPRTGLDRVAAGRGTIEKASLARVAINCERGGIVAVAMNGVKTALIRTECEERGFGQVADMQDVCPRTGGGIDSIDVNAVAARLAFCGREQSHIGIHGAAFILACPAMALLRPWR